MSDPENRLAEENLRAFQQQLARSKILNQALILLLAEARMQADVEALQRNLQPPPRVAPVARLRRFLAQRVSRKMPPAQPPDKPRRFPWGLHGMFVVQHRVIDVIPPSDTTEEGTDDEQTRPIPTQDD